MKGNIEKPWKDANPENFVVCMCKFTEGLSDFAKEQIPSSSKQIKSRILNFRSFSWYGMKKLLFLKEKQTVWISQHAALDWSNNVKS